MAGGAPPRPAAPAEITRALRIAVLLWLVTVAVTSLLRMGLFDPADPVTGITASTTTLNTQMMLFHEDLPVAAALAALGLALLLLPGRRLGALAPGWPPLRPGGSGRALILGCAGAALLASWAARVLLHHGHDFVGDEFIPWFQARIFLAGQVMAQVDPRWAPFAEALRPQFAYLDPDRGLWAGAYRPGHAALRALAGLVGQDALLNPLLAAGSVLLLAHVARRTFPDRPEAPVLAALLLLASPQFLATAASGFSFTAHLFFSLLWLALFLRGDLRGHAAAALVGAFAVGLHQVHVHPLFAAPFLLAHLLGHYGRSAGSLIAYALAYGIALPAWIAWPEIATAIATGDAAVLPASPAQAHYLRDYAQFSDMLHRRWAVLVVPEMTANLLRFAAWISPALLVLAIAAALRFRRLPLTAQLGAAGFVLLVGAHAALMPYQVHGWGYRYVHPALGSLALLAVAALPPPASAGEEARAAQGRIGALLLASFLLLLPWRLAQVDARIAPRAAVDAWIKGLDADVAVVDEAAIWFGVDLIRNEPFLRNRPLVMSARHLTPALRLRLDGLRVVEVGPAELARFGLGRGTWLEPVLRPAAARRD